MIHQNRVKEPEAELGLFRAVARVVAALNLSLKVYLVVHRHFDEYLFEVNEPKVVIADQESYFHVSSLVFQKSPCFVLVN